MNEIGQAARYRNMNKRTWAICEFFNMSMEEQIIFYDKVMKNLGPKRKMLKGKTAREICFFGLEIQERYGTLSVLRH